MVIHFAEREDGHTELRLVHTGLADEKARAGHEKGWTGILSKLASEDVFEGR